MKLTCLKIRNFRLLLDVQVDVNTDGFYAAEPEDLGVPEEAGAQKLEDEPKAARSPATRDPPEVAAKKPVPQVPATILVGANNSGKTSVAEAFQLFVSRVDKPFSINDFAMSCRQRFAQAQKLMLSVAPGNDRFSPAMDTWRKALEAEMPHMSLDLYFVYDDDDLQVAADLLMDLDPQSNRVAIRIEYRATNPSKLSEAYLSERKGEEGLYDYLSRSLSEHYGLTFSKLDPETQATEALENRKPLDRAIRIDFVFAQRHMDDQENSRATRLSHLLHRHYETYFRTEEPKGHEQLEETLQGHANALSTQYDAAFAALKQGLEHFGFPQYGAPKITIRAEFSSTTLFRDNTRIYYTNDGVTGPPDDGTSEGTLIAELPEKYNGLGYKNLIYMILQIQSFRLAFKRTSIDRPRLHLIFIEEPETHLHPQVQSIFTRRLSKVLSADDGGSNVQVMMTTHSPHIVAECGFAPIRYFRSKRGSVDVRNLLKFQDKSEAKTGSKETIRFLKKYVSLTHCDVFFAHKAVLVEGAVERLLLPQMIERATPQDDAGLAGEYYSVLEVGGAHAHMFRELLHFIEIPTLVITDIDSALGRKKTPVATLGAVTCNPILRTWIPKKIDIKELLETDPSEKNDGCIRVAYQVPESVGDACGRSFEEAFIYCNTSWLLKNRGSLRATGGKFDHATADALCEIAFSLDIPKVDFALDLMFLKGWETPRYIREGLEWLANQERGK